MLAGLTASIALFANLQTILSLLAGLLIGIFIGALPGLGPTMVIAILMPLVIPLPATVALIFLIGVYVGGIYGGSISAIWINTPGTPAAAATCLDGFALTKKGKPMTALQAALYASIFGHFFGSTILFMSAQPLARFGLKFGPPEQFALVLFSMTVISAVAEDDMKKGLVTAVIGLFLSSIGTDPISGARRLTFGLFGLDDGVNLFAVLIGVFAVSEVILEVSKIATKEVKTVTEVKQRLESDDRLSVRAFFQHWKTAVRSSAIGTFIGALPGIGTGTAAFVSYGWAKRLSKNPDEIGKGSVEGIIAAEAANNAGCGGALIPLLALGIPGDTSTAVLLGAMIMHGLAPGPLLFIQNITEVRLIYVAIFVAGILLLILGNWILKASSLVRRVQPNILWPIIIIVCVVGVFSVNNTIFDVKMMLFLGLLGYVFKKYRFPAAPLLISFILGPLLEVSLRQTVILFSRNPSSLLSRPIFIVFLIATAVSLVGPYLFRKAKSEI
jgi:putative tricarboxylic transport membrane protein